MIMNEAQVWSIPVQVKPDGLHIGQYFTIHTLFMCMLPQVDSNSLTGRIQLLPKNNKIQCIVLHIT